MVNQQPDAFTCLIYGTIAIFCLVQMFKDHQSANDLGSDD